MNWWPLDVFSCFSLITYTFLMSGSKQLSGNDRQDVTKKITTLLMLISFPFLVYFINQEKYNFI